MIAPSPNVQAIMQRAYRESHEEFRRTGRYPEEFVVTEEEVAQLQSQRSRIAGQPMSLYGMRVRVKPQRQAWIPGHRVMVHAELLPMPARLPSPEEVRPELDALSVRECVTTTPPDAFSEVRCPCGDVIWVMSSQELPVMDGIAELMAVWLARGPRPPGLDAQVDAVRAGMTSGDSLPPIEGMDEGLQCCGLTFPTFAAYMHHRRRHGED